MPEAKAVAPAEESVINSFEDDVMLNPTVLKRKKLEGLSLKYRLEEISLRPMPSPTSRMIFLGFLLF